MRRLFALIVALLGFSIGGTAPAVALSEAQRAYNACTDSYNNIFRFKGNYKAIVAGVGRDGSTRCFWVWDAKSLGEAQRKAIANCEAKFRNCYIYADSNGVAGWSKRISDMGGSDGSRENDNRNAAAIGGFIAGIAGAIAGSGGGGGGGGSDYNCYDDGQGPGTCAAR
jgi:hypothetical protein